MLSVANCNIILIYKYTGGQMSAKLLMISF